MVIGNSESRRDVVLERTRQSSAKSQQSCREEGQRVWTGRHFEVLGARNGA
jgi:hypothetical protein